MDYRDVDWDTADFFPPNDPESNDLLDTIGRVQLPSERIRKFVTPIDPSGNGRVMPFDTLPTQLFDFGKGSDRWGRVGFFMYFRPPGVHAPDIPGGATTVSQNQTNLLHGYEHYRDPVGSGSNENFMAMMPWDTSNTTVPTFTPPTMGMIVNSTVPPGATVPIPQGRYPGGSLNLQEADQLNLYTPTPYDAPFGPHDLEWLYRRDDVDGTNLTSRLSQLGAPVFNNTMTRRLFSVDSWELNTFAAANTAPLLANWVPPALLTPGVIPHLAHGHRKINLNYPLPHISATAGGVPPNEPVRQKWCQETYQMLKAILGLSTQPSGMTPDQYALELAALGQFVVNIVDFRDPDATMTQFLNYDLQIKPATTGPNPQPAGVQLYTGAPPNPSPLIQWGMEYN
ncbi:MAG: hypothetical protein IRY99_26970, partial [Isosphaeraceae bacterium]|nr:hypothetical protein [Isosphaeraceae bacterium]